MVNDTVADTLARIKNAIERRSDAVSVSDTKVNRKILEILETEAFIEGFTESEEGLDVVLKYNDIGEPVVSNFERVSRPGQRIYVGSKDIIPVMNGRGISIISSSSGLLTGARAKSQGVGGEYICKIW